MATKNRVLIFMLFGLILISKTSAQVNWDVNQNKFEYNMTITGVISIHDTLLETSPGIIVGAFNDQLVCVGIAEARYYRRIDKYRIPLMIHGNTENEKITLKAYVANKNAIFNVKDTIAFKSDNSIGNYVSPVKWNSEFLGINTSAASIESEASLQVYPNPVSNVLYIKPPQLESIYTLKVFDLSGSLVQQETLNENNQKLDASTWIPGIYLVKVENRTFSQTTLVVKK